jgi:uncharacterized protein (DUF2235 family)
MGQNMAKNIIICCDGTANEYGDRNSNVVKLYRTLHREAGRQIAYYHPGVGTMGARNALTVAGKTWTRFRGLAFGYGVADNITDAYQYLMGNFEPGDKIFIFGFSRGAYIGRALCGMLQMFGLLSPGNEGMIPYAIRLFKSGKKERFEIAAGFKKTFCIPCNPYFLGLWDTVSSVGWILDPIGLKPWRLPYIYQLRNVSIVRHAVAIDEKRAFFRQNLVSEAPQTQHNVKQLWFAGTHSDVGGNYPEAESALSKIPLRWMLEESVGAGLIVDEHEAKRILGGGPPYVAPDPAADMHNSMKPLWWLGEFWPKRTMVRVSPPNDPTVEYKPRIRFNLFRRRFIPAEATIHSSVIERMQKRSDYKPANLPATYKVASDGDSGAASAGN